MTDLHNCRARLELEGGWRYTGKILKDTDEFLEILDEKINNTVIIRRDQILRLEVLSNG